MPSYAVVIAWVNPFPLIEPGLRVLLAESSQPPDEIIVATRHAAPLQARFRAAFPGVKLIPAAPQTTIPALRSMGIRASASAVVLVTEDHCVPAPDWIERAAEAISSGSGVAGGPVENACTSRLRDWAAFLTEYSGVLRPAAPGVKNATPGNNVAYRRDVAEEIARTLDAGLWESFAFEELERRGVRIAFHPGMLVYHRRPFDFFYFLNQRFHFCRAFAGMRCQSLGTPGRLKYAAGCIVLPGLLLVRTLRNLLARQRLVGRFIICLPLIAVYFAAGAAGEMIGYLLGGGKSLQRVE